VIQFYVLLKYPNCMSPKKVNVCCTASATLFLDWSLKYHSVVTQAQSDNHCKGKMLPFQMA